MPPKAPYLNTPTPVLPYKNGAFDDYVSYCALGGLITTEDGKLSKMSLSQFCNNVGIDRKTAYRWKHSTPDFNEQVQQRRFNIFPIARESACWNRLYLIGMTSQDHKAAVKAITTFLGHFGGLKLASMRKEESRNQGGLVELVQRMREGSLAEHRT